MNGLGAGLLGCSDDFVNHQIGLARRRGAQQHGLVGQLNMPCFFVGFGIHRHGFDAHFAGGGNHTASNLATVSNQNFGKHECSSWRELQRNVAVLAPRVFNFFVFEHDE